MKLQDYLERERIPISQLAKFLDVHPNHLYMIKTGKRHPGYQLAKAIQEFTNGEVTVDELVKPKEALPTCPHCGRRMYKPPKNLKKDLGFKE